MPKQSSRLFAAIVDAERLDTEECLVSELPPPLDAAFLAGGYKAKPSAPALSTLVHLARGDVSPACPSSR